MLYKRDCGFVDLVKQTDGKWKCSLCGEVMHERFEEQVKASLPSSEFKKIGSRANAFFKR